MRPARARIVYAAAVTRGPSLVVVGAMALSGCFRGDFLQNTCEQQGGCAGATGTSTAATTAPPTTGVGTSTGTGTGSGTDSGTSTSGDSDDTLSSGTTEAPPGLPVEGLAFRIKTISIVDPHIYYGPLGCLDVTGFVNTGLQKSIDDRESNVILVAKDYDPDAAIQQFQLYRDADCPAGQDHCLVIDTVVPVGFPSTNKDEGNCLGVDLLTINPANLNQLNLPVAPCVSSPTASVQLELTPDLSPITFYKAQFSAQYSPTDDAPDTLVNAIFYGFVPQSDAEQSIFNFMGMEINLWAVIRGSDHPEACQPPMGAVSDVDMIDLDDDPETPPIVGVYLYLNFTAERVDYFYPPP